MFGQGESGWRTAVGDFLAAAVNLRQWRPRPSISHNTYLRKWLQYVNTCLVCLHTHVSSLCVHHKLHVLIVYVVHAKSIDPNREDSWLHCFVCATRLTHTYCRYVDTHFQTCASRRTHTSPHARCRIYGSFESGLLMERLPLINASFNDSLLKTGGRVIVCFSSSHAGKKWNDVEIYGMCSPVRQNY